VVYKQGSAREGGRSVNEEDQPGTIARGSRLNRHEARTTRRRGVSPAVIAEFERAGLVPHERTFIAVIEALEARGVEFIERGVKMR
jgi:hypothetical protein